MIPRSTPLIKMSRNVSHKLYQLLRVPKLKGVNIDQIHHQLYRNDDFSQKFQIKSCQTAWVWIKSRWIKEGLIIYAMPCHPMPCWGSWAESKSWLCVEKLRILRAHYQGNHLYWIHFVMHNSWQRQRDDGERSSSLAFSMRTVMTRLFQLLFSMLCWVAWACGFTFRLLGWRIFFLYWLIHIGVWLLSFVP